MEHLAFGANLPTPWPPPASAWWRLIFAGHGAAPATLDCRFSGYAADLAQLGGGWDIVIGQSSGGVLAAALATGDASFARRLGVRD